MSVSTPTRITYSLLDSSGTSEAAKRKAPKRTLRGTRSNARRTRPALAPLVDLGDPAVHPDLRRLAHTFLMSAFPSRPVGRTSSMAIRSPKTIRS